VNTDCFAINHPCFRQTIMHVAPITACSENSVNTFTQ